MQSTPYVSIILLFGIQRERAEKSLARILEQKSIENAEVILFDLAFDQYPPLAGSDHPVVKTYHLKEYFSLGALRAKAVEMAHGEVIAFVEDHVQVRPGWLDALMEDFREGHGGVGGIPKTLNPGMGISDAVTMMNYGFFRPATESYEYQMLPGHNSAYRRDILLSFGDILPDLLSSETLLNWKIIERGYTLLVDPRIQFLHLNEESLSMIIPGYYYWNLCFGENRAKVYKWSWWRRGMQCVATPLVPFVRYLKYMLYFWRYDRKNISMLIGNTGLFLYAQGVSAFGIAIGCVFGSKDAEIKFRDHELNAGRELKTAR